VVTEGLRGARVFSAFAVGRVRGPTVTVEVVCWSVVRGLGCCSVVIVSEMASVDVNECRHGGGFGGHQHHNDGEQQDPREEIFGVCVCVCVCVCDTTVTNTDGEGKDPADPSDDGDEEEEIFDVYRINT